jgi:Asp-tRNA(Asn)/Glu-tRNA(Gln) amidotransferase A subunit family amidase
MADGRLRPDAEVHGLPPEVYSTAMQNVTGHPALTLPFGMLPTGLPFGLQITAAHYGDYRLLDIADLMELAYPWARTAPGYESLATVLTT